MVWSLFLKSHHNPVSHHDVLTDGRSSLTLPSGTIQEERYGEVMFCDRAKVFIKSGKGGDGHVSFRRELYVPAGGPDEMCIRDSHYSVGKYDCQRRSGL